MDDKIVFIKTTILQKYTNKKLIKSTGKSVRQKNTR